jgi:DNA (cytosine-5)-methyltransferase 1
MAIPVIDLFAGPGGLGEGFSSLPAAPFKIGLSIEKEADAHQTLELRAFYRQFLPGHPPPEYYKHLRGEISKEELFNLKQYREQALAAQHEAWHAELGTPECTNQMDRRISAALGGAKDWVLIGGPPCQAYSMAGRSRRGGTTTKDGKENLYRQYLEILAAYRPPVFVMENVKGLLSAKAHQSGIFHKILRDLENPCAALEKGETKAQAQPVEVDYQIFSLVRSPRGFEPSGRPIYRDIDFVIKCENYGIPQARHRVILLGLRRGRFSAFPVAFAQHAKVSVAHTINDLPRVRSGLSKEPDDKHQWLVTLKEIPELGWFEKLDTKMQSAIRETLENLHLPRADRGAEFIPCTTATKTHKSWFLDDRLGGVCNHSTRGHLRKDLYRYLFAAAFGRCHHRSPYLSDFPIELYPEHKNVMKALDGSNFPDRFRVQVGHRYATTITSHISRDGHYYIHHDPTQCRSFTLREAARIQTFPDNYFFEGGRTSQYTQVGNAVPPLLARQIAQTVHNLLLSEPVSPHT